MVAGFCTAHLNNSPFATREATLDLIHGNLARRIDRAQKTAALMTTPETANPTHWGNHGQCCRRSRGPERHQPRSHRGKTALLAVSMLVLLGRSGRAQSFADEAVVPALSKAVTQADHAPDRPPRGWPQWGGSSLRNNVADARDLPVTWSAGMFDDRGRALPRPLNNVAWIARLGSQTYGSPVVADGRVFIGTNNGAGYLKRYPETLDLGCLLCFETATGRFLWQYSSEKLPAGRVHDWPLQGICSTPLVEGKRLWFVSNRGEVVCLDIDGFYDGANDGPYRDEPSEEFDEADVIWRFDMMSQLGVRQHNMANCAVTSWENLLFVCTSNGVDEGHVDITAPEAPSFIALDKHTGNLRWADNSPGENILHGQWSCPAAGLLGGVPQVIFGGGDGWLYSFHAAEWQREQSPGRPNLLWKFDCNPKTARYSVSGRSTRNHIIAAPVIHDGLVYVAVGEDPEHGEGNGHLWCLDPTRRGDVSSELAVHRADPAHPLAHQRLQAADDAKGEVAIANPNSAAVWHYTEFDWNGDDRIADFEERMHRTISSVAIDKGLLMVPDFSGLVHCLNAKTGQVFWTHDLLAACWTTPLIVDGKVYVGDEEGKVTIFRLSADPNVALAANELGWFEARHTVELGNSIYNTPIVADGVLYVATKTHLYAIRRGETGHGAP